MLKIDNLKKVYEDGTVALDNISLEIKDNEFVALLGPSGCGKSTTLNIIAGLLDVTEGDIYYNQTKLTDLKPRERDMGMVFQSYALYPHMTVLDNIAFPLKQKGMKKKERYRIAKEYVEQFQINHLLKRKPSQISGGQQQRVSISRAMIKQPKVLLLDEPMSNLDARLKIEIRETIKEVHLSNDIISIIVTHDQEEAMALADKIAILDNGHIQQFDTPEELYNNPKNLFVANFMGNPPMNFIEGRLQNDKFCFEEQTIQLPAHISNGINFSGQAVLGIRPHQFSFEDNGSTPIHIHIKDIENLGRENIINAEIGKTRVRIISDHHFKHNDDSGNILNQEVTQVYMKPNFNLFAKETGENIRKL